MSHVSPTRYLVVSTKMIGSSNICPGRDLRKRLPAITKIKLELFKIMMTNLKSLIHRSKSLTYSTMKLMYGSGLRHVPMMAV